MDFHRLKLDKINQGGSKYLYNCYLDYKQEKKKNRI